MRNSVDVHNFLLERGVAHEMVPVRGRLRSPDQIAAVLGLEPEQVGKVVILGASKGLVAVIVSSHRQVDMRRVAVAAPTPTLRELSSDEVTDATDFFAESVPPVGLPAGTRAIMDSGLSEQQVLYFAGGEASTLLKIRPEDLRGATDAKVARVAR
jgi:prolyl-tRNA editing enzyme YbaK/EbsC (Cys-tRNA(Pro) deacylase)